METEAFKHLIRRIENIEQIMLSVCKMMRQENKETNGKSFQPQFISRQQASAEFQLSTVTVDHKAKKYNVSRQKSGRRLLLNRLEFIKALNEIEEPPIYILKQKGKDKSKR